MLTPSDLETCACEAMYFPFASALFSSFVGSILFNGSLQYNFSVHHLFDQGFFYCIENVHRYEAGKRWGYGLNSFFPSVYQRGQFASFVSDDLRVL